MSRILWSSTVVAALMLASSPASAQAPRPERPSRALFGSGVGDTSQLLTATAGLGAGWDSNLAADARGSQGIRLRDLNTSSRGTVAHGMAALSYSMAHDPVSLGATVATVAQYYPSNSSQIFRREYANARGSLRLPLSIAATGSIAYRPYSVATLYPTLFGGEDVDIADPDFVTSTEHYVMWNAGVGTGRKLQLTRRLSFTADTRFGTRSTSRGENRFQSYGAGGALRYSVGKGLDLKAGYHFARAEYEDDDRTLTRHLIDAGVDYSHSLSFSRRTTVSFGTGTSAVTHPDGDSGRTRFRASGSVDLQHEIGRTWTAGVSYGRGVHFIETWPEPVVSDGIAGGITGSISRRLQFASTARVSTGRVGLSSDSSGFNLYHGSATLSYALTRFMNAGVKYSTYHHRFDRLVRLAPGFGPWVDRQRITAQVSLWAPLYQKAGRQDATR